MVRIYCFIVFIFVCVGFVGVFLYLPTPHHVDYSSDLDVVDLEAFASEVEYIGTIGIGGHRYQALTASV